MKSFLLIVRCVLEGLLGLYMMLATLAELPKAAFALHSNIAYACGMLGGAFILGVLGFYIFRDAVRVGGKIRKKPELSN